MHLTHEEYERAKEKDTIRKYLRQFVEYREAKERYWTSDKLMRQIKEGLLRPSTQGRKNEGWCPGEKQRVLRDGGWAGNPQKINYSLGIPKGMCAALEERGTKPRNMNGNKMREALGSHPDFKNKKSTIDWFLGEEKGHVAYMYMLPKFYCELNSIERVWAKAKRYSKSIIINYKSTKANNVKSNLIPRKKSFQMIPISLSIDALCKRTYVLHKSVFVE